MGYGTRGGGTGDLCKHACAVALWQLTQTRMRVRENIGEGKHEPIPECDDLVSVRPDRDAKGTCEAKVGKLDVSFMVNQQVLWLEVSVQNSVRVAELNPLEQLEHVAL